MTLSVHTGRRARAAAWLAPDPPPPVKIKRFSAYRNEAGTVLGFLSVQHRSGLILHGCKLMRGPKGARWIAAPAVRETDSDGSVKLDANGKAIWTPIVEFADKLTRQRWQEQILAALRKTHPEAFDDGEAP
jgi:hypothetical protein